MSGGTPSTPQKKLEVEVANVGVLLHSGIPCSTARFRPRAPQILEWCRTKGCRSPRLDRKPMTAQERPTSRHERSVATTQQQAGCGDQGHSSAKYSSATPGTRKEQEHDFSARRRCQSPKRTCPTNHRQIEQCGCKSLQGAVWLIECTSPKHHLRTCTAASSEALPASNRSPEGCTHNHHHLAKCETSHRDRHRIATIMHTT